MPNEEHRFVLTSQGRRAPAPAFVGAHLEGRLDGVLCELTLRQSYRNTSQRLLEVVYSFPLPPGAVLLGFVCTLNGERRQGVVVARREAEHRYEAALAGGDAPVLLEALGGGLHSANIGNLKPGDELALELRFTQVLAFEQGRLRLAIPTTIAPRYGDAAAAGLQPQQVPQASLQAEHPLTLAITVADTLQGAAVDCPTHAVEQRPVSGGVCLSLRTPGWLDRDVVILVRPREAHPSLLVRAQDSVSAAAPVVLMAALQAPAGALRERIVLRLLVDCSGSMAGDGIASARAALRGLLPGLSAHDEVGLSRFGSIVDHLVAPCAADTGGVQRLRTAIDALAADLGGTEMEAALRSVFALAPPRGQDGADVLVLTDGDLWQAQEMVAAARVGRHRVFVIGVGSAAAEGVLRPLAEATGGACEFATPGEALEAAALRMLARIRQQAWRRPRIDWGAAPVWQLPLATALCGGDTVIAFAGFAPPAVPAAVRLCASDAQGVELELCRSEADAPCAGDSLARIAAARRLAVADKPQALALALDYQLLSAQTHCVLVHQRAAADQATEPAELQRIESMLAAGWGGMGSTCDSGVLFGASGGFLETRVSLAAHAPEPPRPLLAMRREGPMRFSLADNEPPAPLRDIAMAVARGLVRSGGADPTAALDFGGDLHRDVQPTLDAVMALGCSEAQAWLLMAHWVNTRPDGLADAALAATFEPLLDQIEAGVVSAALALLEQWLGGHSNDAWRASRAARLQRAMLTPRRL